VPLPESLPLARAGGTHLELRISADRPIFVLGANGTGKSALLVNMANQLGHAGRRVVASRPLAIEQDAPEITAAHAHKMRSNYDSWDRELAYRAKTPNPLQRAQLYLFALSELENHFSRDVAGKVRSSNAVDVGALRRLRSPIQRINDALSAAGFLISVALGEGGRVQAQKGGSPLYGVSDLSDGERAALFLLVEILDAKPETVVLIDEPERHIHRSLLLPLIKEMTELRPDCCLIIATHDIELPIAYRDTQVLLVRGMPVFGQTWDIDLLPDATEIPPDIRESILGSRRRVVFVEGDIDGIDHGLYNIILGEISVVAKRSSRDVEQATLGARSISAMEWLQAWGIVDRDGRTIEQIERQRANGIWCIPLYSVESIYYHPDVIKEMVSRSEILHGPMPTAYADATNQALDAIAGQIDRLAARAVEKSIRHAALSALPAWKDLSTADRIEIPVNPRELYARELAALQAALGAGDWAYIVRRCPIRETQSLSRVASALRFRSSFQYEAAVRKALLDNTAFRAAVLGLLGRAPDGLLS
jgi:energy-coupling factor transporter ATP-binding protein EcfA2